MIARMVIEGHAIGQLGFTKFVIINRGLALMIPGFIRNSYGLIAGSGGDQAVDHPGAMSL